MAERRCCHDPMGNTHWKGEPSTCCHIHAENLPSNNEQRGEAQWVPQGWTAQEQAQVDALATKVSEVKEHDREHIPGYEEQPIRIHRHTPWGTHGR